ncbi:hypothetical protein QA861_20335 [Streptomyces sp. B21-083]
MVGISADAPPFWLVGAALAEQNEWTEACRYVGYELLAKARRHPIGSETHRTVLPTELTA